MESKAVLASESETAMADAHTAVYGVSQHEGTAAPPAPVRAAAPSRHSRGTGGMRKADTPSARVRSPLPTPAPKKNKNSEVRETAERQRAEHGIPYDALLAYMQQYYNARARDIGWGFDLLSWWAWWQADGRWEKRGVGRGGVVMQRIDLHGPYMPENVRAEYRRPPAGSAPVPKRQPHSGLRSAYMQQRYYAARQGVAFEFSFDEWRQWWNAIGLEHRSRGGWRMVRVDPAKGFVRGNVRAERMASVAARTTSRAVVGPDRVYSSASDAARAHGVSPQAISWRCKHNKGGWSYV